MPRTRRNPRDAHALLRRAGAAAALLAGITLFGSAPAEARKPKLTQEQKDWIAARDAQPLSFVLPASEIEAAWARAQEFIGTADPVRLLPIQIANETLIQTSRAAKDTDALIFATITRAPEGEGFRVTVTFGSMNLFLGNYSRTYAHSCAYYMVSGKKYPSGAK